MGVREQGAKARLRVLHFGKELFATVGAAKHGHGALNMRNVFRKIRGKIFSREEIFAGRYFRVNSIFAKISSRENISNSLFAKISSRENNVLYSSYHHRWPWLLCR